MKKRICCRKTRQAIQDALDRMHPASRGESGDLSGFLSAEVRRHLEGCPECREFQDSMGTFAPVLRTQLEAALEDYPGAEVAVVLQGADQGSSAPDLQEVALPETRGGAIPAAFRKLRDWLFGPAGKPVPMARLAVVSALAAVLICLGGVRIYMLSRTQRIIEQQIERIFAVIYQEPLLPGVESALLRTQPSLSDYMEDLSSSGEIWGEDTGIDSYLD